MLQMPVRVFIDAAQAAESIPYGEGSAYHGFMAACETHPAMKTLTDWWNANAPDPQMRCAGYALTWVATYRGSTTYRLPTNSMPDVTFADDTDYAFAARVGNNVIIEFLRSQHALDPSEGEGTPIFRTVDGGYAGDVCVSNEDIYNGNWDEAWYSLDALAAFRRQCPGDWHDIVTLDQPAAKAG